MENTYLFILVITGGIIALITFISSSKKQYRELTSMHDTLRRILRFQGERTLNPIIDEASIVFWEDQINNYRDKLEDLYWKVKFQEMKEVNNHNQHGDKESFKPSRKLIVLINKFAETRGFIEQNMDFIRKAIKANIAVSMRGEPLSKYSKLSGETLGWLDIDFKNNEALNEKRAQIWQDHWDLIVDPQYRKALNNNYHAYKNGMKLLFHLDHYRLDLWFPDMGQ